MSNENTKQYVEVAVMLPVSKTLTYEVPLALNHRVAVGKRVLVPVRNTRVMGYILGLAGEADHKELKTVQDVLDNVSLFPNSMVPFFRWIADYYLYPIGEVIKGALPGGLTTTRIQTLRITDQGRAALAAREALSPFRQSVLQALEENAGQVDEPLLSKLLGTQVHQRDIVRLDGEGMIERFQKLRPGRVRPKKELYVAVAPGQSKDVALSQARRKIITMLEHGGEVSLKALRAHMPSAGRLVRKMAEQGLVHLVERDVYRDPFGEPIEPAHEIPTLTAEQTRVVSTLTAALDKDFQTFLLHGVTGSGKTEVYMQTVAASLKKGHEALVLVPEIALISQTERRFRARFGDCVALLHSGLSQGERFDQWMRIARGKAKIAIGARSAVFAPFQRLGIIIVDEEHDDSYKQGTKLRYNARDLAVVRAKFQKAVVLLGSATPSVQSYHNVRTRKYRGLRLRKRIDDQELPKITVVDLRERQGYQRAKPFITEELKVAMRETLERGEQVLLFLNRRGFANYPTCTSCGQPVRCRNCEVTMTLHQGANAFKCHYCGYSRAQSTGCPNCGSPKIKLIGLGTERVEAKVKEVFPQARVARMDRDTTLRKGALTRILRDLRKGRIDILIGTQMVAKGHHYPNITLVGILCADLSLNFPDFRAGERTFQLLAQVAGRAGRGAIPGRVILQTFNPGHFCITTARDQDYLSFYSAEIGFRRQLSYPPYCRLLQILITGKDRHKTARYAAELERLCRMAQSQNQWFKNNVALMGPVSAPLARVKQRYRWHILLKGNNTKVLHDLASLLAASMERKRPPKGLRVTMDVDPVNML